MTGSPPTPTARAVEDASITGGGEERTAASWLQWRDDRITQAAVAWVLTTVFIRFCEDNGLLTPAWITGPGSRRQEALDAQQEFFRGHPEDTGREWLLRRDRLPGEFPRN